MKIKLILLLSLIYSFGCNKDDKIQPINEENFSIETAYNYRFESDYEFGIPQAYLGDSVIFTVEFKSDSLLEQIDVCYRYQVDTNQYFLNSISLNKSKDSFSYIYPLTIENFYGGIYYEKYKEFPIELIFKYIKGGGIVKIDTLPPFFLKTLDENYHQRLYNINAKNKSRGFSYHINQLMSHNFPSLNLNQNTYPNGINPDDQRIFMLNIPNDGYNYSTDSSLNKNFINGFFAPNSNHYFAKLINKQIIGRYSTEPVDATFELIETTKNIYDLYNSNPSKITEVVEPKVGELYAFRYTEPFVGTYNDPDYRYRDVYGIIEVVHIENDNLTSENGGNDGDYIEFRLKSFGLNGKFLNE